VEQQDEFLALNAHVQVLKVMKHHLDCPKLLQYICTSYTHDHKELCIQFTGLDLQTILASMKMHSCHTSIQFLGLYTIAQLPLSLQSKIQFTFDTSLDGISFILQVIGHYFPTIPVSWKRRVTEFTNCRVSSMFANSCWRRTCVLVPALMATGARRGNQFSQSSS
jgi:hypothetical protein